MIYESLARSDVTHILLAHPTQPETPTLTWEQFCDDYKSHYFDNASPYAGRCFVIDVDGEAVGQVNYNTIDMVKGRTELDIWMRSEATCGKGYGPDALRTLCDYLFREFGVHEFLIQPSASNLRAIRAYEKAEFRRVTLSQEDAEAEYGPKNSADSVYMTKNIEAQGGDRLG